MKAILLTGNFIKPQVLVVVNNTAIDVCKWLKTPIRNRRKLRHQIVNENTLYTNIEIFTEQQFQQFLIQLLCPFIRAT
jgi:hypothetical protein